MNAFAQDSEVARLSEPIFETEAFEVFGSEMDLSNTENAISLTSAMEASDQETELIIETTVNKVCQKKGCFFVAVDGENSARVTFKDYGFFIPTNSTGKEVVLRGVLTEKTLSEEQVRHFAEDAGENSDDIVGEQKEYSIVATSIMIPKSK
jgi:hypothetical protein